LTNELFACMCGCSSALPPVASGAVSWASEHAQSLFAAVGGELRGDGITVAVTAIDVAGPVFAASDDMPADGRFEIGSVTKTMTATLLACLVGDGTVALGDPIGCWLDAGQNGRPGTGRRSRWPSSVTRPT
jgi:CubicO group peptidase (beta-lactamase class C family)